MFKNIFKRQPRQELHAAQTEPIFPIANFSCGQIETKAGIGIAIVNKAYDAYPNKKDYPWCAQVLIEFKDKNENGHPTDEEANVLNDLEDRFEKFLKRKHTVHFIGRVTRSDFRDLLFYINHPIFDPEETKQFMDEINAVRSINFSLDKDETWDFVSDLIR